MHDAEEVQCKDRDAEVQTKYVQMFSRGIVQVTGREVLMLMLMQRCRGAEGQRGRCRGGEE
jgi:hypothetical protein